MDKIVHIAQGVTILGGGTVLRPALEIARAHAPFVVAADGGAATALRLGVRPEVVIGDMDSLDDASRRTLKARLYPIAEQDSTDFEKCLSRIDAPFLIALGMTGSRADHSMAALNVLARHPGRRLFLISGEDAIFLAPQELELALPVGTRLSLFPLAPVTGKSEGLHWPIAGLSFSPLGRIGTSNRTSAPRVRLQFDAPHMLVILPWREIGAVLAA